VSPGPKNAKSLLKFSKNSAGQIVPKIKILRARYEVKSPLPNGFLSLLATNSNAYSCARPRTKFVGHTVLLSLMVSKVIIIQWVSYATFIMFNVNV